MLRLVVSKDFVSSNTVDHNNRVKIRTNFVVYIEFANNQNVGVIFPD